MGLLQCMDAGTPPRRSVSTLCCGLHTSLAALEHRLAAACRPWHPLNAAATMEWTSRSTMS